MAFRYTLEQNENSGILLFEGRMLTNDEIQDVLRLLDGDTFVTTKNWICDLSKLDFCNSTGLNLFIRILTKVRNNGGEFVLCSLSKSVFDLFSRSKLIDVFQIFSNQSEAMDYLKLNSQK